MSYWAEEGRWTKRAAAADEDRQPLMAEYCRAECQVAARMARGIAPTQSEQDRVDLALYELQVTVGQLLPL